jgi:hypothetical protein
MGNTLTMGNIIADGFAPGVGVLGNPASPGVHSREAAPLLVHLSDHLALRPEVDGGIAAAAA